MADEEQRRAYAHYMGATTSGGQQYFYPLMPYDHTNQQQLAGIPPPAPSPPIRAPSVGSSDMAPPAKPSSHVSDPRSYAAAPPDGYTVSYHYGRYGPPPPAEENSPPAAEAVHAPPAPSAASARSVSGDLVQHLKTKEHYYHYEYDYRRGPKETPPPPPPPEPAPPPPATVPVLLCHTCSECGKMRSAGYHRENPVIPGKPLVQAICRRCEKKKSTEKQEQEEANCVKRVTRVRSCTVDVPEEPCDWPSRSHSVHVRLGRHDHRGRHRSRSHDSSEDIRIVSRGRSHSRPIIVKRSESQTRLGLRSIQPPPQPVSPPMLSRKASTVRPASPSPERNFARTHVRIIHRNRSQSPPFSEFKGRSPSPPDWFEQREDHGSTSAERRLASHPMAYRAVLPDQRAFLDDASTVVSHNSYPCTESDITYVSPPYPPPSRGRPILKPADMDRETIHRRLVSGRRSMESTMVEVGGPRVQFTPSSQAWKGKMPTDHESTSSKKDNRPETPHWSIRAAAGNGRATSDKGSRKSVASVASASNAKSTAASHDKEKGHTSSEEHEHYEQRVRSAYRHYDPGPPPSPPSRQLEEMYIRHVSPPAPRRSSTPHPNATTASERPPSMYGARSQAPPPPSSRGAVPPPRENKDRDLDEVTASDTASQKSGEVEIVRSWRGVDEHGHPCTFIEERTTKYVGEPPRADPKKGKWREV